MLKPGPLLWREDQDDLCKLSMKTRSPGDTARLNHGEHHRIHQVSPGGVITLFITSKWRGDWGFLVNGVKVPWPTYTGTDNRSIFFGNDLPAQRLGDLQIHC